MICCVLVATLIGALLSVPRRLLAIRAPTSVAWRPGSASDLRNLSRWSSIANAMSGLKDLLAGEINFRLHLVAAGVIVVLGFWLRITSTDWRWLTVAIVLVLLSETLNTAIERTCDAVTSDIHPTIRVAKDIASTAVLLAAISACILGALTLWPYISLGTWCG